jgi:uncharacterized protein involved in exopolysaccharide biosynthesis
MSGEDRAPLEGGWDLQFLRDPLGIIRRRWPWMALALLAGLLVTAAFSYLWKPEYVASATVLVSSQQIPADFVQPTVRDDSLERINAMVGDVLSQKNLTRLIEKHDLYPELRQEVPLIRVLGLMRSRIAIDSARGLGPRSRHETARLYTISFEADSPLIAATIANELAAVFTDSSIQMRTQQAQLTTDFLRQQLERADQALRAQDREIREFKERYRGELPNELEANLGKLERLQRQRQSLAMQIAEAETRLATVLATPSESSPEARLAGLRERLGEAMAVHTDEHPNVASLRRQIATLEAEIAAREARDPEMAASRPALAAATRRTLLELRNQLAATERQLVELDARVANTPSRQEKLGALEEKAAVLRENYLEFLRKVQEAELAQSLESAQQGERVSVLDRAEPPAGPKQPLAMYLLLGIAAAFVLALAVGVLLELLDPVALTADQVESASNLPVLGSVSWIS